MPSDHKMSPPNSLEAGKPVLGRPVLRSFTREQHDAIVKLMNERQLEWEVAVAEYEAAQSTKTA